ncbi:MAG: ATP-binding protein [Methanomicrobiaceae archaeon]|nr:ATP-binding protein [Methanomicrobiaceae archaeon]
MKIAVASGKGGTGKTTVAANLALAISEIVNTSLIDCDVEEPNLHIFFEGEVKSVDEFVKKPRVDESICTLCKECAEFCRFGAISIIKEKVLISDELCHSCGGCRIVCPADAISEIDVAIGKISEIRVSDKLLLIEGRLNPGQPAGNEIIKASKKDSDNFDAVIFDAPPGAACPFIETISDSDYCILVTEPTPFGLHDLKAAYETGKVADVPMGVVINRSTGKDDDIESFCFKNNLEVLMKIPNDLKIAVIQNNGGLFSVEFPEWKKNFLNLYEKIAGLYGVAL